MRVAVLVVVAAVACGGPPEIEVQAPGAVAVYANEDGAGWATLTPSGSGAYDFSAYQQYEVGEQCLLNGSPQRYTYEVLATTDDDLSPLQLLACGSLSTPWTLNVEMQQPGIVSVDGQNAGSATGPWVATFMVAAARYDVAATDGARVAVVRDVHVDADTTVSLDLDTDGTALETFHAAVAGGVAGSVSVVYTPDNAVRDVISTSVVWSAPLGIVENAQLPAVPPAGVGRTDAQSLYAVETELDGESEAMQTATLDNHYLVFAPLPQLNLGNGRVAGSAIGDATSVSFAISGNDEEVGAVWISRTWLDSQPNPSEAAFDDTIPAFAAPSSETVEELSVCQQTETESFCAN